MRVRFIIGLKETIPDHAAEIHKRQLEALGFEGIHHVSVKKGIDVIVGDNTSDEQLEAMGQKFLANKVIERYRIIKNPQD